MEPSSAMPRTPARERKSISSSSGAEIRLAAARAVRRDGGYVHALDALHAPFFTRGVRTTERNSTAP